MLRSDIYSDAFSISYKMFNASVSTLSVARICCCLVIGCSKRKYKECYVAFTLETNPGAFVSFWKHISKLASSILWVCTTSANMIFCPVFVFLLLSSALGEDTGESECSHSYISSQHVVRKKKKKTLSETKSADCSVLCCEMLIIQFLFSAAEEVNVTVWHHASSSC